MKSVIILGSTGSIGKNTLDVIRQHGDKYAVKTLTARGNVMLLAKQAMEFKVSNVVILDKTKLTLLEAQLKGTGINVFAGEEDLLNLARESYDIGISAIVGVAGLKPTVALLENTAVVGVANKEAIVCAGNIIDKLVTSKGTQMLPMDSEHVAILQVLEARNIANLDKIILTASGGPFRHLEKHEMDSITPDEAVKHPNWSMGRKITVDSSTMMNKGLEVIEACKLFEVGVDKIDVIVHPESIIHSMVSYNDGSVLAQMGTPHMTIPISHVLAYPNRIGIQHTPMDLVKMEKLTFEKPNYDKFPLLRLALEIAKEGEAHHVVLNTANEVAVEAFLDKKIKFPDIYDLVQKCCQDYQGGSVGTIDEVINLDGEIRSKAFQIAGELRG